MLRITASENPGDVAYKDIVPRDPLCLVSRIVSRVQLYVRESDETPLALPLGSACLRRVSLRRLLAEID